LEQKIKRVRRRGRFIINTPYERQIIIIISPYMQRGIFQFQSPNQALSSTTMARRRLRQKTTSGPKGVSYNIFYSMIGYSFCVPASERESAIISACHARSIGKCSTGGKE